MLIYVGKWKHVDGGIETVEGFTQEEAEAEVKRERSIDKDRRIDTYTPQEFEAEINNDLDEENPFSLNYWVRIFAG